MEEVIIFAGMAFIIAVLLVLYFMQYVGFVRERQSWAAERRDFADRLTAHSLGELSRLRHEEQPLTHRETAHERAINKWKNGG